MKLFATLFFFISFSTLAADCQRSARREAQDVFGREAQVQASLSQGIGDEHFLISFRVFLRKREVARLECESYADVCDCRVQR
jgi:hypothetical protein